MQATSTTLTRRTIRDDPRNARATESEPRGSSSAVLFYAYLVLLAFEWLGLQTEIAPLRAIRFTTLLGYSLLVAVMVQQGVRDIAGRPQARIFFALIALTIASMSWAVVTKAAFDSIRPLVDYTAFFFLTAALIDRRERITKLAWTLGIVCAVLVFRNFEMLGQTLRAGGFKAGYFLGDGNDFAWGMVVALPLIAFLFLARKDILSRLVGLAGVAVCLIGIVGTGSRGGSLALGTSLLFYLVFVSKKKTAAFAAVAAIGLAIAVVAPGSYFARMKTVATYEEDSSAQSRLMLWGYAFQMATDFPLGVGAGNFASAYGRYYAPVGERSANANDVAWGQGRWLNAHSIYFKALGEYGFLGFSLMIWIVVTNLRQSLRLQKALLVRPNPAIPGEWAGLVSMSFCGYAAAGIFLGGLAYPHVFFVSGLIVAIARIVDPVASSTRLVKQHPQSDAPASVESVRRPSVRIRRAARPSRLTNGIADGH